MTISKKLLMVGLLAAGMQFGIQASDHETKQLQVLHFVKTLQKYYGKEIQEAAKWLDKQMTTFGYYAHDYRLLKIINLIVDDSTIEEKATALLALKTKDEKRVAKEQANSDEQSKKYAAEHEARIQKETTEYEKHKALRKKQAYKDLAIAVTATIFILPTFTCLGKMGEHAGTLLFNKYFPTTTA